MGSSGPSGLLGDAGHPGDAARANLRATGAQMSQVGANFRQEGPTWAQLRPNLG